MSKGILVKDHVILKGRGGRDREIASLIGQITDLKTLKSQAEVTSKQAGIKLVVDWIEQNNQIARYNLARIDSDWWYRWFDDGMWQAFLKSIGYKVEK